MSQKTASDVIDDYLDMWPNEANARALIEELDAAGFSIVPKEPTPAMIQAGDNTDHTMEAMSGHPSYEEQVANIWRAMVAAALKAPRAAEG